jgi:hypothetical protein
MKSDLLVICGLILLIITVCTLFPGKKTNHGTTTLHIVEPRETLWTIAQKYNPHKDPREVIWDMRAMNEGLDSCIYPGQQIVVPVWE